MGGGLATGLGALAGIERVLHEHRDGHRAHAAGDGCDGFAERGHGVEVHVADDAIAGFLVPKTPKPQMYEINLYLN